jgi:hypothetical protein
VIRRNRHSFPKSQPPPGLPAWKLVKRAGFTVGAGRATNEFHPNTAFCSRFLEGVSYAWQDGNTRELLRLALIFTSAIPLHLGIGVLKMEFGLLMTAGVIGAETPSRQAQQTLEK